MIIFDVILIMFRTHNSEVFEYLLTLGSRLWGRDPEAVVRGCLQHGRREFLRQLWELGLPDTAIGHLLSDSCGYQAELQLVGA